MYCTYQRNDDILEKKNVEQQKVPVKVKTIGEVKYVTRKYCLISILRLAPSKHPDSTLVFPSST